MAKKKSTHELRERARGRSRTPPRRGIGKAATKLLARTESVKTFAGARRVMADTGAAVVNGRITSREANIVTRAADPMLERLKKRFGL